MANRGARTAHPGAADFVPEAGDLGKLADAAQGCRGCDLYRDATQAVFGRGSPGAHVVLIGEQPGDVEDRQGEPFVGPAGQLLRRALEEAGIAQRDVYLTNAVKHFRWRHVPERGQRRIHQRPDASQIVACGPWLDAELARLRPRVLVALGATAGEAIFGPGFRVGKARGSDLSWRPTSGPDGSEVRELRVVATVHPSSVLRSPDRDEAYAGLVADLRSVARLLR